MRKIFILFLFILGSCGYQPLYKINNEVTNYKIKEFEFSGDKKLGIKISKKLPFVLVQNDKSLNKIILDSNKNLIIASKDSKGQVTSYRATLIVKLKVLNNDGNIIDEKILQKEFYYSADENKFKLEEYKDKIENNLIENIVQDIIMYLNYSWL